MPAARVSTKEAAAALTISERQLRKDAAEGCPHEREAGNRLTFDLAQVRRWRKANRRTTTGGKRGGGRPRTAASARAPRGSAPARPSKPAKPKAPDRPTGSGTKAPPVDDETLGRVAAIIGTKTPRLSVTDASALKMETQAALLQLDLEAKCGALVEVDALESALARGLHASRRYLDASRRATALAVCQALGVPGDRAVEVEQLLADRDDEYARRMRSAMDRASGGDGDDA